MKSCLVLLAGMRTVFHCLFHKEEKKGQNKPHVDLGFRPSELFYLLWASFNSELATKRVPTRLLRAPLMLPHTLICLCHFPESHRHFCMPHSRLFIYLLFSLPHYSSFLQVIDCPRTLCLSRIVGAPILMWVHQENMEQLHKVYALAEAYRAGQCLINSTLGAQLVLAACQRCVGSAIAQLW